MLQKVLVTVVFSPILASRYQKLPQVGQKQNVDSFKIKIKNGGRESSTNWVSILNAIKKVLYILRATLKKFTIGFRHFLGHHISEMLGKALAFPSPGSATAFTTKLPSL